MSVKAIIDEIRDKTPQQDNLEYIFRGERQQFPRVSSGLYRVAHKHNEEAERDKEFIEEQDKLFPEDNLLEKYKDIVEKKLMPLDGRSLTNWQDNHLAKCREFIMQLGCSKPIQRDIDLLAKIQHMGGYTKFIDFTWNFHVALYFACQRSGDIPSDQPLDLMNGRVIIMTACQEDIDRVKKSDKEEQCNFHSTEDATDLLEMSVFEPAHPKSRPLAQESVLVTPYEGYIPSQFLTTVNFPWQQKRDILGYLKDKGITDESLFKDVPGFVAYQKQIYHWMERPPRII